MKSATHLPGKQKTHLIHHREWFGQHVAVPMKGAGSAEVMCIVIGVKECWGRINLLLSVVMGKGSFWTWASRCRKVDDTYPRDRVSVVVTAQALVAALVDDPAWHNLDSRTRTAAQQLDGAVADEVKLRTEELADLNALLTDADGKPLNVEVIE